MTALDPGDYTATVRPCAGLDTIRQISVHIFNTFIRMCYSELLFFGGMFNKSMNNYIHITATALQAVPGL